MKEADLMPAKQGSGGSSGSDKNRISKNSESKGGDQAASQESDSFYKMYNKEIKVNQDEIPIILAELTDAAFNFIQRENYEKALILLQKTEGVLEVVSLDGCSRDKYISFITYNNMAMCFQKLGMLEECIIYLKGGIQQISNEKFYKSKRISMRTRRTAQECKLKLQLCAILSQNQNHSEALENARKSVKLSHTMFKDMDDLCQLYIDKINYRDNLLAAQEQSDLEDAERNQLISMVLESSPAREIPKNFLEQSISLVERSSLKMGPVVKEVRKRLVGAPPTVDKEKGSSSLSKEVDKIFASYDVDLNGKLTIKECKPLIQKVTFDYFGLESGVASDALMLDIFEEMDSNQNGTVTKQELMGYLRHIKDKDSDEKNKPKATDPSTDNKHEDDDDLEEEKPDMRSVLGFLNQNEWIYNLNIGNIMQIQPISMKEFLQENQDEVELGREAFLSKLSILTVSYFCMSTEMRFLLQSRAQYLKPEVKKERELESEFWHAKALEISCTFLPSECPLLNHVLLSYQKHHDPTLQPIKEDEESEDVLSVLRPLKGIEQSKYQPIIRRLPMVKVNLSPSAPIPLKKFLRQNEESTINEILQYNPDQVKRVVSIDEKEIQVSIQVDVSPKQMIGKGSMDLSAIEQINQDTEGRASRESLKNKLNDESNDMPEDNILNSNAVLMYPEQYRHGQNDMLPFSLHESKNQTGEPPSRGSKISDTDTQKLAKELYNSHQEMNSIDGLERQILEGVDSPNKSTDKKLLGNKQGFPFDSQDSITGMDSLIEESESKMYDVIVSKLINNPRIDKRTLIQRFITKIEMESNNSGQLANDLNQIKHLADNFSRPSVSKSNQLVSSSQGPDAEDVNTSQQSNVLPNLEDERRHSEQQIIQRLQKEPSFDEDEDSIANEMSVEHKGVQEARQSTHIQMKVKQHTNSQQVIKPQSAKITNAATSKTRYDTSQRTRSSSHNMKAASKSKRQKLKPNNVLGDQSKYKKVRSYLEGDSLFKDIDKSTEYQDPLILNVMEQSVNTDQSAAIDVDEINLEARSSQKSHSKSRERVAQTEMIQDSVQSVNVNMIDDERNKSDSNIQSNSFSRPSTAPTNVTRHTSSNLRRRKRNNLLNQQPQKCLVATRLQEEQRARSESSSRGRYQKYQQRYTHQNRQEALNVEKEATASTANFANNQQKNSKSFKEKRLSLHGASTEHDKYDQRPMNKISSKRLGNQLGSKYHNTSHQGTSGTGNKTSKLTKLVSHKQIETNFKPKKSKKQVLSQTKHVVSHNKSSSAVQATFPVRGRSRLRKRSSKSNKSKSSRSKTRSGSDKRFDNRINSNSNKGSGSENNRNLQNELLQHSFDIITAQDKRNQTSEANIDITVARLHQQPSINDLQRQVLENQRTLLDILQKQQRNNSADKDQKVNDIKKQKKSSFSNLRTTLDLQPKKQQTQGVSRLSQPNLKMQSQAQILLQAQSLESQPQSLHIEHKYNTNQPVVRGQKENTNIMNKAQLMKMGALQNSASQTTGLTNLISQIGGQRSNSKEMNKSLQYLKRHQKHKGYSQPKVRSSNLRSHKGMAQNESQAGLNQQEFKKNILKEVNYLKSRLSQHFQNVQRRSSPPKNRSGSNKRSGERKNSNSRSRSPTQPNKAMIPRRKSYGKKHTPNMNFTAGENNVSDSLLNMSVGDRVLARNHASTGLGVKRKVDTLLKNHLPDETNLLAYNSLDDNDQNSVGPEILNQNPSAVGNIGMVGGGVHGMGNNHHSLSMFDSEAQLIPLQHQLSHNAIIQSHNLSQNYALPQKEQAQMIGLNRQLQNQTKLPQKVKNVGVNHNNSMEQRRGYRTNLGASGKNSKLNKVLN